MTMTPPGWYLAEGEPEQFRWWDGEKWGSVAKGIPAAAIRLRIALPPDEAQAAVIGRLASRGGQIQANLPGTVIGTVQTTSQINPFAAIVLFLLCIVPFIIYLITASRTRPEPFAIHLAPDGDATVITTSGTGVGLSTATWAVIGLPRG